MVRERQGALRSIICILALIGLMACTRSKPLQERPPFTGIPTVNAPAPSPTPSLASPAAQVTPAPTQLPGSQAPIPTLITPSAIRAAEGASPTAQPTATPMPTLFPTPTPLPAEPTASPQTPSAKTVSHIVGPGETLYQIARLYGTSVEEILAWNPTLRDPNYLVRGTTLLVPIGPGGRARTHTVRYGENLSSIAALYGVTVEDLMRANGLTNRHLIYAGQQLIIPE
ncbi:MAG: LysM peptidoglycan-binding domain-containing protein [Chloroflexi bacterium]|nr:LysM peptidoglycan-binding domain-containing protein [Chloroflexota bacterium]